MHKTAVVITKGEDFRGIEAEAAVRVGRRLLQGFKPLTLIETE